MIYKINIAVRLFQKHRIHKVLSQCASSMSTLFQKIEKLDLGDEFKNSSMYVRSVLVCVALRNFVIEVKWNDFKWQ